MWVHVITIKEQIMAEWVLEGLIVSGFYLDEYPVEGRVELSRVAYGGTVRHTLELLTPLELYKGVVRDRVILDHSQIVRVRSSP
jgi:hypothetical protein